MKNWTQKLLFTFHHSSITRKAFTLAEVLITLGIIGIVAEITIPTIVQDTQKKNFTISLEKFYSVFNQGMKTYMVNQGCSDMACTGLFDGNNSDSAWESRMNDALPTIFKIGKIYGNANPELQNFTTSTFNNASSVQFFYMGGTYSYYAFLTIDGFIISIMDTDGGTCTKYPTYQSKLQNACAGPINVDINGFKGPNKMGRDVFQFALGRDGLLYPRGGVDNALARAGDMTYYWNNSVECVKKDQSNLTSATGYGCAARIMEEGWQMNY